MASRFFGFATAGALGVLVTGVDTANASTHLVRSATAHKTLPTSTAKPRANQSDPVSMSCGCNSVGGDVMVLSSSAFTVLHREGRSMTSAISSTATVIKDRPRSTLATLALGENVHVVVSSIDVTSATSIDVN